MAPLHLVRLASLESGSWPSERSLSVGRRGTIVLRGDLGPASGPESNRVMTETGPSALMWRQSWTGLRRAKGVVHGD